MSTDEYNGWTNRETWALNLWLTNDQSLYEMTRERVAGALSAAETYHEGRVLDATYLARKAGEAVEEFWDELTDPGEGLMSVENILTVVRDIGSDYRVNWDEIGAYWLEDLGES